jgi:hypothetical protein
VGIRLSRAVTAAAVACPSLAFLCAVASASASASDRAAPSPGGGLDDTGPALLAVQEAGALPPGRFELAFLLDNYDRDPLGIDVVDGSMSFRLGVARRLELYAAYQITRSVSTPGADPVPSPPLDVVVLDGRVPDDPYRAMYWPLPYLSHHGARVDEWVPGEYTLGARASLFGQRGPRPAVSVSSQITAPGTKARYDLSKGSGSGSLDIGLHTAASWRYSRVRLSANLGISVNGDVDPGDRFVVVGEESSIRDSTIRRPNFLQGGLGARIALWRGLSAVAEVSGWSPVGSHTPMQSESGASDLLGGVLLQVKNATLAFGVRWHLRPQPDGLTLSTGPLAGAVDLSGVPAADRARFLDSLGAGGVRPDANLVVTGLPADTPLPDGARYVAPTYQTHTRGNLGLSIRVSIRLGR